MMSLRNRHNWYNMSFKAVMRINTDMLIGYVYGRRGPAIICGIVYHR